jgi:hypothetical protein
VTLHNSRHEISPVPVRRVHRPYTRDFCGHSGQC